jgi:hypothetical protein
MCDSILIKQQKVLCCIEGSRDALINHFKSRGKGIKSYYFEAKFQNKWQSHLHVLIELSFKTSLSCMKSGNQEKTIPIAF